MSSTERDVVFSLHIDRPRQYVTHEGGLLKLEPGELVLSPTAMIANRDLRDKRVLPERIIDVKFALCDLRYSHLVIATFDVFELFQLPHTTWQWTPPLGEVETARFCDVRLVGLEGVPGFTGPVNIDLVVAEAGLGVRIWKEGDRRGVLSSFAIDWRRIVFLGDAVFNDEGRIIRRDERIFFWFMYEHYGYPQPRPSANFTYDGSRLTFSQRLKAARSDPIPAPAPTPPRPEPVPLDSTHLDAWRRDADPVVGPVPVTLDPPDTRTHDTPLGDLRISAGPTPAALSIYPTPFSSDEFHEYVLDVEFVAADGDAYRHATVINETAIMPQNHPGLAVRLPHHQPASEAEFVERFVDAGPSPALRFTANLDYREPYAIPVESDAGDPPEPPIEGVFKYTYALFRVAPIEGRPYFDVALYLFCPEDPRGNAIDHITMTYRVPIDAVLFRPTPNVHEDWLQLFHPATAKSLRTNLTEIAAPSIPLAPAPRVVLASSAR